MAKLTELSMAAARHLLERYGRDVIALEPLAAGSVNSNFRITTSGGEVLFARIYEEADESGAQAELSLLDELSQAGVPTVRAIRTGGGDAFCMHENKPFSVYPWVEGYIRCQGTVSEADALRVGVALARVHSTDVRRIPAGRFGLGDLRRRLERIERDAPEYRSDVRFIRERLAHYERLREPSLPAGLIHGDLFRDNVLFGSDGIVALLDFESACHGPFVYDLMVTVEAWCYSDGFQDRLVRAMISAYDRERPLTAREKASLPTEAAIAALRFATTRITDYAMRAPPGTPPARDFRRFLARLDALEAGAVRFP